MNAKMFYEALHQCKAVKEQQKIELEGVPLTGGPICTGHSYPFSARRIIAMTLAKAAKGEISTVVDLPVRPGMKHGPLYAALHKHVLRAGVHTLTVRTWLEKYTDHYGTADRGL